jgi:hypothetical protein
MSCVQEVRMKTVKELLEEMSREVNQLTDLRKKYKVNVKGQRVEGIKIINAFDEDIRDFLSSYFRGSKGHIGSPTSVSSYSL